MSKPEKILLLNLPRWTDSAPVAREECAYGPSFALPIPNTLLNIGSTLKGKAHVRLHDAALENTGFDRIETLLDEYRPDAVVTTILNYTLSYESRIAGMCASRGIKCIAVPAPIGCHEQTATAGPFYFVVHNEPEKTILDWVDGTPVEELRGAAYLSNGTVITNKRRDPYFGSIPETDWSLIPKVADYGWLLYQVSRNCRWGCKFCVWATGQPQFKRVDVVMRDLEYLKRNTRGHIGLLSASITQDREWFDEMMLRLPALRIRFGTDIRADEVTRDDLKALKRAGCRRVLLGVESLSQQILEAVNKRETVERNIQAIRWCNEVGLPVDATLIFNLGETDEDAREYARLIMRAKPTRVIPLVYKFIPGTRRIDDTPLVEKHFWGSDPLPTREGVADALRRIDMFKQLVMPLRRRVIPWYIARPSLWGSLIEEASIRFRSKYQKK